MTENNPTSDPVTSAAGSLRETPSAEKNRDAVVGNPDAPRYPTSTDNAPSGKSCPSQASDTPSGNAPFAPLDSASTAGTKHEATDRTNPTPQTNGADHAADTDRADIPVRDLTPRTGRFPSPMDLLAMLGIMIGSQVAVSVVARLFLSLLGKPATDGRMNAMLYFFSMLLCLGLLLYYRHTRGGKARWTYFSLKRLNPLLLAWSFGLIFSVGIVIEPVLEFLPRPVLQIDKGWWAFTAMVVFAPLFEESIYRGFLLESIRSRYGLLAAWLLSSAFFGLIHIQPYTVLYAMISGLILGFIYIVTRSLWASILLHAANNATCYLFTELDYGGMTFREMILSDTLYGLCYIAAALLLIVSTYQIYKVLKKMKEEEKLAAKA